VDSAPDTLLRRKFGSAGNRTQDLWTSCQELLTTRAFIKIPWPKGRFSFALHGPISFSRDVKIRDYGQNVLLGILQRSQHAKRI
jgi:hypothetical protein